MSLPSLKHLSKEQYVNFRYNIKHLAEADHKISLFEYTLQCIILRYLDPLFLEHKRPAIRYSIIDPLMVEVFELLSVIAWRGSHGTSAENAFTAAMNELVSGNTPSILPEEKCGINMLDRSLGKLAETSPQVKKLIIKACAACVLADSEVTIAEAELLRAIADTLNCPVPPLVPGTAAA